MPNIGEASRANIPLDHARHVDIQQRPRLTVLEEQDRIRNVLSHTGHGGQFARIGRKVTGPGRRVLRKALDRTGAPLPEADRAKMLLQLFHTCGSDGRPAIEAREKGWVHPGDGFGPGALEQDFDTNLLIN